MNRLIRLVGLDGRRSNSGSPEPEERREGYDFSLAKEGGEDTQVQVAQEAKGVAQDAQQMSAADYDPNVDRRLEEARRVWNAKMQDAAMDVDTIPNAVNSKVEAEAVHEIEVEEADEEVEDDIDDMFAVDSAPKKKVKKSSKLVRTRFACLFRIIIPSTRNLLLRHW